MGAAQRAPFMLSVEGSSCVVCILQIFIPPQVVCHTQCILLIMGKVTRSRYAHARMYRRDFRFRALLI